MFDSYLSLVFLISAVFGGTILLCQFALTLFGMGGVDLTDAFSGDGDGSPDLVGDTDHAGFDAHGNAEDPHGSAWLLGVISFRTLVAAATFFGLAGLSAAGAQQPQLVQLAIALVAGTGAMYGVHSLMRAMSRLGEDGTVRVRRAIGQIATVYVPIAAEGRSAGKVQVSFQNRLMEFEAITQHSQSLATGTKVRVIAIAGNVLEVEPLTHESATSGVVAAGSSQP